MPYPSSTKHSIVWLWGYSNFFYAGKYIFYAFIDLPLTICFMIYTPTFITMSLEFISRYVFVFKWKEIKENWGKLLCKCHRLFHHCCFTFIYSCRIMNLYLNLVRISIRLIRKFPKTNTFRRIFDRRQNDRHINVYRYKSTVWLGSAIIYIQAF